MSVELDHECMICGKKYHHCNACVSMGNYTPWRAVACSIECYQVFLAYREYKEGLMTKEQMREVLINDGFQGKQVRPELQDKFTDILAETPNAAIEQSVAEVHQEPGSFVKKIGRKKSSKE